MNLKQTSAIFSTSAISDVEKLPRTEKRAFLQALWPHLSAQPDAINDDTYGQYLNYLGREFAELEPYKDNFAAQSLDSFLEIVSIIKNTSSKHEAIGRVRTRFINFPEEALIRSVDLSVRLWLTVNVRTPAVEVGPIHIEDTVCSWPDDLALQTVFTAFFDELSVKELTHTENRLLEDSLTVLNLVQLHGIHVRWTDNLLDHLKLEQNMLFVYQHKICLDNHAREGEGSWLPQDVVCEALDTLNLLFHRDSRTQSFLAKEGQNFYSAGNCGREIVLRIDHYKYWRGRLLSLSKVLHRPPNTLQQMWNDRRNLDRWFAFWTSTCSVTLAVVGIIITTIASVVGTFYTAKQYEIARAQACLMPDAEKLLPQFCA